MWSLIFLFTLSPTICFFFTIYLQFTRFGCDLQKFIHFICLPTPPFAPSHDSLIYPPILSPFSLTIWNQYVFCFSFRPLLSFPLPSVFLLHVHSGVKGISLAILHLFTNTHTHTCWHRVTPAQCKKEKKIYCDMISGDRAIDRQQYSHDRNHSPSSLSQCLWAHFGRCGCITENMKNN